MKRRTSRRPKTVTGYMQKYLSKPEPKDRKPVYQIGLTSTGRQKADAFDETGVKAQILLILSEKGPQTPSELKSQLEFRGIKASNTLNDVLRQMNRLGYIQKIMPNGGIALG